MRLTPLEIRKHEFASSFRGFDKTEVLSFMQSVSEEFEELLHENVELKEQLKEAKQRLETYAKIEAALQNTLVATQEAAEQMKTAAQEKCDAMLRKANSEAERIIREAYEEVSRLRQEYSALRSQKASFLVSFRSLLESEMKLLELLEKEPAENERGVTIRRRPELSDEQIEKLAEEFNSELARSVSPDNRLRPVDNACSQRNKNEHA